jgi:hypothetical protein
MKRFLHSLFKVLTSGKRPRPANRCHLRLEMLEDRLTPSSIAPHYPPNPCVPAFASVAAASTHYYPPNPLRRVAALAGLGQGDEAAHSCTNGLIKEVFAA